MSIRLITFSGQTVTPKTDGIIQDASIGQNGIFYGCGVTASGNSLHIDGGYGLIKGRYFEIDATTVPVTLATSDTLLGRLYVKLDLSNTEAPIQILTATGETLPSLEQDADANFDDGVWEMELATFNVTTTEISSVVETYQTITDNATQINALNSNLDSAIKMVSFSRQYSASYQSNLDNLITVPSGYTAISPVRVDTGNANIAIIALKQNGVVLNKFSGGGTSTSQTCSGYVMCIKSTLM